MSEKMFSCSLKMYCVFFYPNSIKHFVELKVKLIDIEKLLYADLRNFPDKRKKTIAKRINFFQRIFSLNFEKPKLVLSTKLLPCDIFNLGNDFTN